MPDDERLILSLNCGSSSLKFGVYRAGPKDVTLQFEGEAEEIGQPEGFFWVSKDGGRTVSKPDYKDHGGALARVLELSDQRGVHRFWKAGHRVVHGGPEIRAHQTLTQSVFDKLEAAVPFAPLHLPASLAVISALRQKMPGLQQVICLDTAFHRGMPEVARTLALPAEVRRKGVERYGFHGLSLESILAQLERVPDKLVIAHLGNGSSITAVQKGKSIDTSMGLTPDGGIMMGTRTGDLDPGVMIFLARHGFAGADELEDLVSRKSGLLGVSGSSSDVRELMKAPKDAAADLALRMFCYQASKTVAAMAAALGGLDLLVFTGGIGENAAALRQEIGRQLEWISGFETRVLPAREDLQIARIALQTEPAA